MAQSIKPNVDVPSTGQVYNYAEEISHVNDELRLDLHPIVFRLFSIGRGLGQKVDVSFYSDYGIYYDPDDSCLINALQRACPHVNWFFNKIYHRVWGTSRIQILNAETSALIGQIETRRYMGRKIKPEAVRAGEYGPTVVNLEDLRSARAARLQVESSAEGQPIG